MLNNVFTKFMAIIAQIVKLVLQVILIVSVKKYKYKITCLIFLLFFSQKLIASYIELKNGDLLHMQISIFNELFINFTDAKKGLAHLLILFVKRVMGIEPTQSAWKAEVLPLNYTRMILIIHVTKFIFLDYINYITLNSTTCQLFFLNLYIFFSFSETSDNSFT